MDIFFSEPGEIPLPPDEVRIRDLEVEPYPDGRRVRVKIELTPCLKKPSGEIKIVDGAGATVSTANFIEAITPKLELTMHLRSTDPNGEYKILLIVFYSDDFEEAQDDQPLERPGQTLVDQSEIDFQI